jgi:hypothetical protein
MFISVQDQVNEKNVALVIKAGKLTTKTLAKAMKIFLSGSKKPQSTKNYNGIGKQTVKQLTQQGAGVSNIEINDGNIKSFETIARKYGVDFAVKKDATENPPKWLVFFKGRDTDAITSAFKEFSAREAKRGAKKPSLLERLEAAMEKVRDQIIDKTKHKDKGRDL